MLSSVRADAAVQDTEVWKDRILGISTISKKTTPLEVVRQDAETLQINQSVVGTPLTIGSRSFKKGLGTHSTSHIRVNWTEPIRKFSAWVGVDSNPRSSAGTVVFAVSAGGKELFRSKTLRSGEEPVKVDVDLGGAKSFDLFAYDAGDGIICDHADWAEAVFVTEGGRKVSLDELAVGVPDVTSKYPFSFVYNGKKSDDLLDSWQKDTKTKKLDKDRTAFTTIWTDPATGLKLHWEAVRYADFPAVEWLLYFENAGSKDTPIIEDIQGMDVIMQASAGAGPVWLHSTKGGIPNPTHFEPYTVMVDDKHPQVLGAESGRSSTKNFPFFKVESGNLSMVVGVGWSGCWQAKFRTSEGNRNLRMTAGMEKTHFLLHPGERVRSPRILALYWQGDTWESNAQFRQLIYKHYVKKKDGKSPLPIPFCNTCFTRGGGWLNECNEENQISLIKAYAPLGLEALMTDAGWFTGGWPNGAGNWDVRKDAYPNGMAPVAKAAKDNGMTYGLWFEPERVIKDTTVHREHPEWCLTSQKEPQETYLLNFGLPEVQDYFFDIVKGFMQLPGFRVYRQDFNMDPLPYWRFNDSPDRQGITEIKYIEGLYAYWDRIGNTWPDALMEECASGGHRIDLETVMRLHIAQKTDYWFDNEADQSSLFGLSHYLPNNCAVAHLIRFDDYSFHSTMASSLCLGWIADDPGFDVKRGKKLLSRYRELRHLLVGAWYPILSYPRDHAKIADPNADMWLWSGEDFQRYRNGQVEWLGSQYHRPDLNEGMILVFRRADSPYKTVQVSLRGLDPEKTYELSFDSTGKKIKAKGSDLMESFEITIPERHKSDLIHYRGNAGNRD